MSEYLKLKADMDDYIESYNTKKSIYKLESTAADLEGKTARGEICKLLEGLSLTKDTCYIKAASDWGESVYVYFEGIPASTTYSLEELFLRKRIENYKGNLERALRRAVEVACENVSNDARRRFNKYVDIIMASVTDDMINRIKALSTKIEVAQAEGTELLTNFYTVKCEGRKMLNHLACAWYDEIDLTKGMTVAIRNRHNFKIEDRVIKSVTYPNGVKTLRFEGTSSVVTDMQRIVASRTFLINNKQYLDFAKETTWIDTFGL